MNKYIFACLALFGTPGITNAAMVDFEAHTFDEDRLHISVVDDHHPFNKNEGIQGPGSEGMNISTGLLKAGGGSVSSFNSAQIAEENLPIDFQTITLIWTQRVSSVNLATLDDSFGSLFGVDHINALESIRSIPILSAVWLFGSGFIGLIGISKKLLTESFLLNQKSSGS